MTLSDREKIISHWFVTMQTLMFASIVSGAKIKDLTAYASEEMENYRVTNCPRISSRDMRSIHDDIQKFNKAFGKLLDFKIRESKTFGI